MRTGAWSPVYVGDLEDTHKSRTGADQVSILRRKGGVRRFFACVFDGTYTNPITNIALIAILRL